MLSINPFDYLRKIRLQRNTLLSERDSLKLKIRNLKRTIKHNNKEIEKLLKYSKANSKHPDASKKVECGAFAPGHFYSPIPSNEDIEKQLKTDGSCNL